MSRPRSGRGANAGGSRAPAQRGVYVQAPKSDIYVMLLGVSLGAMFLGCLLLLLVLNSYGWSRKVASITHVNPPVLALNPETSGFHGKIGPVRL